MRRLTLVLATTALAGALAGCGQKGALYLPEKNGAVVNAPATSAPATSAPAGAPASTQESQQGTPKKPDGSDDSQTPQ
jgi:predicted small lipoprotein YifL